MEVGMHGAGFCCDLCLVDIPCAVFLIVDVDVGSLVYSTNYYCKHQVLNLYFCQLFSWICHVHYDKFYYVNLITLSS